MSKLNEKANLIEKYYKEYFSDENNLTVETFLVTKLDLDNNEK